jgi:hypothetical protein
MNINIDTTYDLGQKVDENGMKGTVVRIEIIINSNGLTDVFYVLDNGGKIKIGFMGANTK